jgi:hypothetical protein
LVLNLLVPGLALLLLCAHSATHCDGSVGFFSRSLKQMLEVIKQGRRRDVYVCRRDRKMIWSEAVDVSY